MLSQRLPLGPGRNVITAAGDQRMALESPDNQHGIYTGALIRSLQGTVDTSRNGLVEVGELADFVEAEVARVSLKLFNYEQFPHARHPGPEFSGQSQAGRSGPLSASGA